ncbi:MAG: putative membrane protein [Elusimicrobia bacterium]|nr:MAG: putative membrane protein [Elusimicrobiota bacterium]KAF0154708.1 MAG: putative membrane protein [Elusimicrobiota bacterium]
MSLKYSHIKCSKCGHELDTPEKVCPKCGGPTQKACGSCGFLNSVEKKYCDSCGTMLEIRAATGPSISGRTVVFQTIGDTVDSNSFRGSAPGRSEPYGPPGAPPAPAPAPEPEKTAHLPQEKAPPKPSVSGRSFSQRQTPSRRSAAKPFRFFSARMTVFYVLLAAGLAGMAALLLNPYIPKFKLMLTARRYLSALSSGDYETSYKLLSENSRQACTYDEYHKNSEDQAKRAGKWEFDALEVFLLEENAAVLKYRLKEGASDWKDDYISFVAEGGGWARPYIWNLFAPIEAALEKGEFPQALSLAQKLAETDPMDPRTSGYLCATQFFMKIYDKAAASCARTAEASRFYPVGFSPEDIFWYTFYQADSLRFLNRYREAVDLYGGLLVKKELSSKEQCPLYMGRADALVRLGDYEGALADARNAQVHCLGRIDADEADKRLRYINGQALDEAVEYVKNSRFKSGGPTLFQARAAELSLMRARGIRPLPQDRWLAEHAGGPEYRVMLREELPSGRGRGPQIKNLHIFKVNLWTGTASAERVPGSAEVK